MEPTNLLRRLAQQEVRMRATPTRCLLALLGLPLVAGFGGLSWVRTAGEPAADGTFTQPATVLRPPGDAAVETRRRHTPAVARVADGREVLLRVHLDVLVVLQLERRREHRGKHRAARIDGGAAQGRKKNLHRVARERRSHTACGGACAAPR